MSDYDKICNSTEFWDLIIITVSGSKQKEVYNELIRRKKANGSLSINQDIWIVCDPPGIKIESLGATLHCLEKSVKCFGAAIFEKKNLIIHSAGFSKRLPSYSVLGKLFASLPVENRFGKPMDIFDYKIISYAAFLPLIPIGSFVISASDDIEIYSFNVSDVKQLACAHFVALGHISPLEIGCTHGVYILPKGSPSNLVSSGEFVRCFRVMQKPSIIAMDENQAIFKNSIFWFDADAARRLLKLYSSMKPLACETDIYRDLLQCFGEYCETVEKPYEWGGGMLSKYQRLIWQLFRGEPLDVLLLRKSKFYHLGTMEEYLNNFCSPNGLGELAHIKKIICSKHGNFVSGILLCSILTGDSFTDERSVIEFCDFRVNVNVGPNTILSHCRILNNLLHAIPVDSCFYTVPIFDEENTKFVTCAFGISDNLKLEGNLSNLSYFGRNLNGLAFNSDVEDMFDTNGFSLWNLKIFPVCCSMEKSLSATLTIVENVLCEGKLIPVWKNTKCVSCHQCLTLFDWKTFLMYRDDLVRRIES